VSATIGLRRGELRGMRWSDIEFDRRTLTVARSVKHDRDDRRKIDLTALGRVFLKVA
jgi:integrase